MGNNGNGLIEYNELKTPRGIIGYSLPGHSPTSLNASRVDDGIKWKLTGNLGGEDYRDKTRGPLNEGALWVERSGFHLPSAPTEFWAQSTGPAAALTKPGVALYTTTFTLDLPLGWDVPLSFTFQGDASGGKGKGWRAQLWMNGYHFGKFANRIGPQHRFPVPVGILNHRGKNDVAVSIWALEADGAKPGGFELVAGYLVRSGFGEVNSAPMSAWKERAAVY